MDDDIKDDIIEESKEGEELSEEHSDYQPVNRFDAAAVHHLSGMYQNWFWTMPRTRFSTVPSRI